MRHNFLLVSALTLGVAAAPAFRGADYGYATPVAKTGKERLSDKSSDEQRLDDCKVPEARRSKSRPANCREQR